MPEFDVKLEDGTHELITAPGERAAAIAAQQVTGHGVEEVEPLPADEDGAVPDADPAG